MFNCRNESTAHTDTMVLVDENDKPVGEGDKESVHRRGDLHRAFSIFAFDDSGRLLLQRRAATKYHSGGLWANTCCGHPRPGEETEAAAHRRLREEFGLCGSLTAIGRIRYRATVGTGMTENELAHIYLGRYSDTPVPDPFEISEYKLIEWNDALCDVTERPHHYSPWLRVYFSKHRSFLNRAVTTLVPESPSTVRREKSRPSPVARLSQ